MTVILDNYHRDPPPGFRGFRPDLPVRFYTRHLPHWRQDGATYSVTFRLNDALPPDVLRELRTLKEQYDRTHPAPRSEKDWEEYARKITQLSEDSLDTGYGACYFAESHNAKILADALQFYQKTQCEVPCLVVMPNHAHAVMKPLPTFELEDVLQGIKAYVARQVNQRRNALGSIWEQESYDRIIRDTKHLENVVRYFGRNGTKANLPPDIFIRWISPEWQAAGWDFD